MGAEDMPKSENVTREQVVVYVNEELKKIIQDNELFMEKFKQAKEDLLAADEKVDIRNIRNRIIEPLFKNIDPRIQEVKLDLPAFKKGYKCLETSALSLKIQQQQNTDREDYGPVVTDAMKRGAEFKQRQEMKRAGVDDPKDLPGEEK